MMEFAAACGRTLADSALQAGGLGVGLTDAGIPAAVILTASPATAPSLECRVELATGNLEVASLPADRPQGAVLVFSYDVLHV